MFHKNFNIIEVVQKFGKTYRYFALQNITHINPLRPLGLCSMTQFNPAQLTGWAGLGQTSG